MTSAWTRSARWDEDAACRTVDPDELFSSTAKQQRAKAVCTACTVRTECLGEALDNRIEFGGVGRDDRT
jgi:WhiB family redox-sensing transcriptional regulator